MTGTTAPSATGRVAPDAGVLPNELARDPHRRYNPLIDEWVLVSAGRTRRPWLGAEEPEIAHDRPTYVPDCYLCPGNVRANGDAQPGLRRDVRVRQRLRGAPHRHLGDRALEDGLLRAEGERGVVPRRVLLAPPRPDPRRRCRRRTSGASSTSGPTRPSELGADYPLGPGVREPRRGDGRLQPASARPDLGRYGAAR